MHAIANLPEKKKALYADIEVRYRCLHERRELRLRQIADSRSAYYRQCVTCGHAGQAISAVNAEKQASGQPIPEFDYLLEQRRRSEKSNEYAAVRQILKSAFDALYPDYLRSQEWLAKRQPVMERANGVCEECRMNEATDIHHKTYDRVGAEPPEDLSAVCRLCHNCLHGRIEF